MSEAERIKLQHFMSEVNRVPFQPHASTQDHDSWEAHWKEQGQSWRTEPEIDEKRQTELAQCRQASIDVERGIYPFKGMQLSRADVEWLLATHEKGRGPIDWSDESQRGRIGLDLRGADLRRVDLQNLPLACLLGDVSWDERRDLNEVQRRQASVLLSGSDLKGAHLEGARLGYAYLQSADLRQAHLEHASLVNTRFDGAYLLKTHLQGAIFWQAHLDETYLWQAHLAGASLTGAHMDGALLENVHLCEEHDKQKVGPMLLNVRWGEVNLSVVEWSQMKMLGEEYKASQEMHDGETKDNETRLKEYINAVRANRQLAVALQTQGLNEDAGHFAYRAQILQRIVLRRQKRVGQYIFSWLLDLLAGYGYRPGRTLIAYLLVIVLFASLYFILGQAAQPPFSPLGALIFSVTSFHGRGFFPGGLPLDSPRTALASLEAVTGLFIEISFIATFTQRFYGKY